MCMLCPKSIILYGIYCYALYKAYPLWITFSNNLYRTVLEKIRICEQSDILYCNKRKWEKRSATEKWMCVRACMCVFCEYILRCFLKSNFYNRHIVCQNPDSEYWLLIKRYFNLYIFIIIAYMSVNLWGRSF